MRSFGRALAVGVLTLLLPVEALAQSSTHAAELYQQARAREIQLRKEVDATAPSSPKAPDLLVRMRTLAGTYEDLWRLFPTSGYSDNALWQGAMLAADAFWQAGEAADRATSLRLFQALKANFPTSSLLKQIPAQVARLEGAKPSEAIRPPVAAAPEAPSTGGTSTAATPARQTPTSAAAATYATLTAIRREVLPDVLRVTLELAREPVFSSERIDGPPRVFIDLQNTRASESLKDATLPFSDDVVKQIRVGRQLNGRTRVVLDLSSAASGGKYSIYALYDPFRLVIDFERRVAGPPPAQLATSTRPATQPTNPGPVATGAPVTPTASPGSNTGAATRPTVAVPAPASVTPPAPPASTTASATSASAPKAPSPVPPSTNSSGSFSLSRQLGLGVSRIVIDAGHGGRDPGAQVKGLSEAEVTLDIALRLEKLLTRLPGVEVVLTRRTDSYVQLEERTAIANRTDADLFLSIHANASDNAALRGIETYFLNLSPNPEAGVIAARENASSSRTMHDVADILKAIALNNKIDESRDFASIVQASMVEKLRTSNKELRNLGVKQAPFMVLIGATMPSILAEISFITNKQEGSLLKTDKYRQQIAEALYQGVMRYQQSLKKTPAVALNAR